MSQREPCERKLRSGATCGHEKDSHHPVTEHTIGGIPSTTYHACLASFCECDGYVAPKVVKP